MTSHDIPAERPLAAPALARAIRRANRAGADTRLRPRAIRAKQGPARRANRRPGERNGDRRPMSDTAPTLVVPDAAPAASRDLARPGRAPLRQARSSPREVLASPLAGGDRRGPGRHRWGRGGADTGPGRRRHGAGAAKRKTAATRTMTIAVRFGFFGGVAWPGFNRVSRGSAGSGPGSAARRPGSPSPHPE